MGNSLQEPDPFIKAAVSVELYSNGVVTRASWTPSYGPRREGETVADISLPVLADYTSK